MRIAVVGCGDIAISGHLPAIARHADVELSGVVDNHPDRAAAAATAYGVPVLAGLDDVVRAGATAVVVATPPEVSPQLTIDAVERGLDVLCEKPMAVDLASAEAVAEVATASESIVQIGFKNRFSPLVRAVRRWLDEGLIGSPVAYTLGGFDESYDAGDELHTSRIAHFLATGPSFVHEGAHFADYLAYLTGSVPLRVRATGLRSRPELASANFVSALVDYANGDVARLEIGWQFPVSPRGEFRALGSDGVAVVDRAAGVATLDTATMQDEVRLDGVWNDVCFDAQLDHFADCVRRRATPETSAEAGVQSLRLGLATVRAMASGETVPWG